MALLCVLAAILIEKAQEIGGLLRSALLFTPFPHPSHSPPCW